MCAFISHFWFKMGQIIPQVLFDLIHAHRSASRGFLF
jgi:hypothetical protein